MKTKYIILVSLFGFLAILVTSGCDSDDASADGGTSKTVVSVAEFEPNDTYQDANNIQLINDADTTLAIQGIVRSDGTFPLGGPNGDVFDIFSFIVSSPGTYSFTLSELTVHDLNLSVLTVEAFTNPITDVNEFESIINAPVDGAVESVTVDISAGVLYFIRVKAINTNDLNHQYTVFASKM